MSVAENTTQIPEVAAAVVNDLLSTISNTFEAPENATKTILKESQAVIDETTKLMDNITSIMAAKNEPAIDETTKAIMSEGQAIVGEATKLVESAVESVENISKIISEEEKRLTETISRLSIEMEQDVKKSTGLFARIHKFVKLIASCTHGADKSVKPDHVDVKVANVV